MEGTNAARPNSSKKEVTAVLELEASHSVGQEAVSVEMVFSLGGTNRAMANNDKSSNSSNNSNSNSNKPNKNAALVKLQRPNRDRLLKQSSQPLPRLRDPLLLSVKHLQHLKPVLAQELRTNPVVQKARQQDKRLNKRLSKQLQQLKPRKSTV